MDVGGGSGERIKALTLPCASPRGGGGPCAGGDVTAELSPSSSRGCCMPSKMSWQRRVETNDLRLVIREKTFESENMHCNNISFEIGAANCDTGSGKQEHRGPSV